MGLFLLTVFVNLYLVQLACNLPHLVQRLRPVASFQAHQHSEGHEEHSHTHAHETSSSGHRGDGHAHGEEEQPASPMEDAGCCAGKEYAPILKASPSVELPSLTKAPFAIFGGLYHAVLSFLYKRRITAVSHAPPDAPVPKIPDIRLFLHSLII